MTLRLAIVWVILFYSMSILRQIEFRLLNLPRIKFAVLLLALAFILRLGAVWALRDTSRFYDPSPDGAQFNTFGLRLAAGDGYTLKPGDRTSFRAPGLPFLLAGIYLISYENYRLVYLVFCVIGSMTCVLTYLLAAELLSESLARWAGLFAAVYFSHIYLSTVFASEGLFALCLALSLLLFVRHLSGGSLWSLAGAGLVLGYSTLVRPTGVLLLPLFAAVLLRSGFKKLLVARNAFCLVLTFCAVVAPWSVRNYKVHHAWVLVATNDGSTFCGANNDIVLHDPHYLGFWISTVQLPGWKIAKTMPDEVSRSRYEWSLGKAWVMDHLSSMPLLMFYRFVRFWLPEVSSGNKKFVLLQTFCYLPFLVLMVGGIFACRKGVHLTAPAWLTIHSVLAAALLVALLFHGMARFRDVLTPILMIYSALAFGLMRHMPTLHGGLSIERPSRS